MNTFYFIVQQTMFFAIPLLIVGLGAMYSERSGVSNIALEGIMIIGAFVGVISINVLQGVLSGQLLFIVAIAIAALAGFGYSILHAWSAISLRADQTISGTALNLFAPAFCIFLAREMSGAKQVNFVDQFFISKIPVLGDIPVIGPAFFCNCYISTFIGLALLAVLAYIIEKTPFGLRLCACGENPDSAAAVGVSVSGMRYKGVAISGLLGGAGGLIFVVPTSTSFAANVSGYGFLALAVLILGQWKPVGIFIAAFFFGILKAFSSSYSGIPFLADLSIPAEVYKMIPYILTVIVLAISAQKSRAPKSVGKPYDDGKGFVENVRNSRGNKAKVVCALLAFVILSVALAFYMGTRKNDKGVSGGYGAQVAFCLSASGSIDDKSFHQNEWEGIVDFTNSYDLTRKYYTPQSESYVDMVKTLQLAVKGNASMVVAGANTYENAIYAVQDEYPEVSFLLVDSVPKSLDGKDVKINKNVLCISTAEQEAGFLAGYAAVMDGYRNLGFVGGVAVPAVLRYGYGFVAGADYAAVELGLKKGDVNIRYNYAGTFEASPEVLSLASSWYQSGTEVIFACGGMLGNSVMKAAETYGAYVIGVDSDQSPESATVITSALKNIGEGINNILTQAMEDNPPEGGQNLIIGAENGAVGLPMKTSKFRKFNQEQYEAIYEELASGRIDVPDDTAAAHVDGLPLKTVSVKEIK